MVTQSGQFKKLKCREGSQLFKLSQLCYHFLSRFENIFFDIPSNPPPIAVRNSLTNQFYQKNLRFCIFSTNKKSDKFLWDPSLLFSFAILCVFFFFLNMQNCQFFLEKLIGQWIPDGNGRGIARGGWKCWHWQKKGEGGVRKMLTLADKGERRVWIMLKSQTNALEMHKTIVFIKLIRTGHIDKFSQILYFFPKKIGYLEKGWHWICWLNWCNKGRGGG